MPRRPGGTAAVRHLLHALHERGITDATGKPPSSRQVERCWTAGLAPKITGPEAPSQAVIDHYAAVLPLTGRGTSTDKALVLGAVLGDVGLMDAGKVRAAWRRVFLARHALAIDADQIVTAASRRLAHGDGSLLSFIARNLHQHGPVDPPYETNTDDDTESPRQLFESAVFNLAIMTVENEPPVRPEIVRAAITPTLPTELGPRFDEVFAQLMNTRVANSSATLETIDRVGLTTLVAAAKLAVLANTVALVPRFGRDLEANERLAAILTGAPDLILLHNDNPPLFQTIISYIANVVPTLDIPEQMRDHFLTRLRALRDEIDHGAAEPGNDNHIGKRRTGE